MEDMWDIYLDFVTERHRIWELRSAGQGSPWTENEILRRSKFTNVFRVLDTGSQYLLRELLLPAGDNITLVGARAFLYRYNNRPEPWDYFREQWGRMPTLEDIQEGLVLDTWQEHRDAGHPIFGAAYKMFSGRENAGLDRLTWITQLTGQLIAWDVPFLLKGTLEPQVRLSLLQSLPRCADFMSMQILTDIGYSGALPGYDEDDFVLPGPGAKVGAEAVGMPPDVAIQTAWEHFRREKTVLLDGLYPSKMDIQNTFCEFGKYNRYLQGARMRPFTPSSPGGAVPEVVLPDRWRYLRGLRIVSPQLEDTV